MTFDGDVVILDISEAGITLPSGWSIEPLIPPRVRMLDTNYLLFITYFPFKLMRKSVDNYKAGRTLHSCQLELTWKEHAERLSHMLRIEGLIPAGTFIKITRNPSFLGQKKGHIV